MVVSPSYLSPSGRGVGVRRLNRRPLLIFGAMVSLLVIAVTYTYQLREAEMRRREEESSRLAEPVGEPAILKNAPVTGLILPRQPDPVPQPSLPPQPGPVFAEKPAPLPAPIADPYAKDWERYEATLERRRQAREQSLEQASRAPTALGNARSSAAPRAATPPESSAQVGGNSSQIASYATEALRRQALRELNEDGEERDPNRATEKAAWLTDREPQSRSANYLPGGREAPISPYEVKAGTIIPATMIGGVNSDLPGQILGQVSENVYDTATGRYILIPQGAKLVGTYDNNITNGQERVLVAWTRIILPDSSSVDLGKMPGTDQSGYAGMHDQVNTHFWKMFSSALMLSVLSAGVQISQGGQSSVNGLTPQQTIAAGLGQQLGELGQELARRNARIQPTLEIRPGYKFTVSVTKDIIMRPWRPR